MTLQGPHQVAKQSRTMRVSFVRRASSNSALAWRLCTPSLPIVGEKCLISVLLKVFLRTVGLVCANVFARREVVMLRVAVRVAVLRAVVMEKRSALLVVNDINV